MLEEVGQLVVQLGIILDYLVQLTVVFFVNGCGAIERKLGERRLERVDAVALETHT